MTEYKLSKLTELRLEVAKGKDVHMSLQQGTAEIFGVELSLGQRVNLSGQAVAVFTWDGCTLSVEGDPDMAYVAEETPMVSYINAHHAINNLRNEARAAAASDDGGGGSGAAVAGTPDGSGSHQGPRVVVAGPTDVGKSSLCRMLLNWAVRAGSQPTYVDLDVGQGTVTAPGCLAATPIETPIDVEEGYPVQVPLVFFYGHVTPNDAPELYRYLVDRVSSVLDRRAETSPEVAAAGMVINTLGWVEGLGYELLLHVVKSFKADVVVVLEQDRLYNQLKSALGGQQGSMGRQLQVVKLAKSGGIVARSPQTRKDARVNRVREYFYGPSGDLQPHAQTVAAEQLQVFKIGGGFRAPSSALPLGATSKADPLKLTPHVVGPDLLHSLCAVSHAQAPDQLLSSNVAGFVLITDVDTTKGTVSYLAPCAGPLPGRYLLTGSFKAFLD